MTQSPRKKHFSAADPPSPTFPAVSFQSTVRLSLVPEQVIAERFKQHALLHEGCEVTQKSPVFGEVRDGNQAHYEFHRNRARGPIYIDLQAVPPELLCDELLSVNTSPDQSLHCTLM